MPKFRATRAARLSSPTCESRRTRPLKSPGGGNAEPLYIRTIALHILRTPCAKPHWVTHNLPAAIHAVHCLTQLHKACLHDQKPKRPAADAGPS